jgi:hypothetical protein
MYHGWGRGDVHAGFWWRYLREEDHLEDPGVEVKINEMYLRDVRWSVWTESMWFRIWTGGGLL